MKLIEALEALKQTPPPQSAVFEVQLACGFTPLYFETFLGAHLRTEFPAHEIALRTGLFDDLAGNLDRLEKQHCDAAVAVIEWQDLDPRLGIRRLGGWTPRQLPEIVRNVRQTAARLGNSIEKIAQHAPVGVSLPTLPIPPVGFTPGWQSSSFENDIREAAAILASRISKSVGVRVLSSQHLDRLSPPNSRLDVRSTLNAGFPYSLSHADALAGLFARLIRNPLPKKGLITDLDDTLWLGILGEVNVGGIAWDLDHRAQKHGLYQQFLASMAEAGVLMAVATKNDPVLVEEAFEKTKLLIARRGIFPLEANWNPKSESVSRILQAWNIDAGSVVFVDDSPLDLAEVKAAHPGIECRLFPRDDDAAAYQLLEDLRDLFGKQSVSAEDEIRLESIRSSQAAQKTANLGGSSPEQFLREAEGKLTLSFSKDLAETRALELINKTNQFNLNGKRHTEASWKNYLTKPNVFLAVASYEDKFGPLGKIAVVAGRIDGKEITIDHWVMSCRAFSRRIEHACLLHLFRKLELETAHFDFAATTRNGPLRAFVTETVGVTPEGPFSIYREQFLQRCAPVYLHIEERNE